MSKQQPSEAPSNEFDKCASQRWLDFAGYEPRLDTASERFLEIGVDLQRYCGTAYAAGYLHLNGIELSTALRTLTRPWLRRRLVME